ncbi:MAG: NUDIX hydrolase N-terminal domain-containing protein [Anaerolineae bacterium]
MADVLLLLDQIRSIATTGLYYASDPYNKARYEQLLELATHEYAELTGLSAADISQRFKSELGYQTPKVGVDAAVFDADGRILLVKRSDDGSWCLPCGWAEIGLTPEENIKREAWEETGLEVEVKTLIDVVSFAPRPLGQPHSGYGMIYYCEVVGGTLAPSHETPELGYFDYAQITNWHDDHRQRAEIAYRYWETHVKVKDA